MIYEEKIDKSDLTNISNSDLWKTLLILKYKLQIGRKYLQITYMTNNLHPKYILNHSKLKSKTTALKSIQYF